MLFLGAVFVAAYGSATLGWLDPRNAGATHNFSDVPDNAFFHAFVQFLVDNGITGGCENGHFCPEDPVTRGQMAVFLKKLADVVPVCPPDSAKVGTTCMDKYEASVWETSNAGLIQTIKAGTVTLAELRAGVVQRGVATTTTDPVVPGRETAALTFTLCRFPASRPRTR
jgi:hypothetical protein